MVHLNFEQFNGDISLKLAIPRKRRCRNPGLWGIDRRFVMLAKGERLVRTTSPKPWNTELGNQESKTVVAGDSDDSV